MCIIKRNIYQPVFLFRFCLRNCLVSTVNFIFHHLFLTQQKLLTHFYLKIELDDSLWPNINEPFLFSGSWETDWHITNYDILQTIKHVWTFINFLMFNSYFFSRCSLNTFAYYVWRCKNFFLISLKRYIFTTAEFKNKNIN